MKRLVLCCDGTWNRADQEHEGEPCPTNVVKLAYRVAKRDAAGNAQIIFYDHGVGTGNALDRFSGGAFGEGLEENILDAYRFLVGNYEPGDEIFLFGFSRGAFTARSIAGMLRNCGILKRESIGMYRDAVRLYRDRERGPDHETALQFKRECSLVGDGDVPIKFIGVWDTVGALGIPLRGLRGLTRGEHQFHDTQLSRTVENAFHALAIDEKRAPFEPTLWDPKQKPGQLVSQVWFCGVHSDVGGGYPQTDLSDVALQWMLDAAASKGLALDDAVLATRPLTGRVTGTLHDSKKGLYRLTKAYHRPMGGDATQSLHPSVLERWDADAAYRPANLRAYLKTSGDPRGAGA